MKREYLDGTFESINFFIGKEVEKTPAFGLMTLFVVGLHRPTTIEEYLTPDINHIFFGANHSFSIHNDLGNLGRWEDMIVPFLEKDYTCTLDIPVDNIEIVSKGTLFNFKNFIPQIRIPLSNITSWPENTMIKIDDVGFNETNPGVWCHKLENLLSELEFTDWKEYSDDKIL